MRPTRRIGIDLDGVLINHREHKRALASEYGITLEDWQLNSNVISRHVPEDALRQMRLKLYARLTAKAPAVEGSMAALAALKAELFVISARRADMIRFAQDWLVANRVYDIIPAERIFFCGSDDEKRKYCERLNLDVFLDDRVAVLDGLPHRTHKVLFDEDGVAERLGVGERLDIAVSWEDALRKMTQPHATSQFA